MHYPRVPRPYWRDRMRKMRALGLNTLCTYVFWDLHEPEPGKFDKLWAGRSRSGVRQVCQVQARRPAHVRRVLGWLV